MTTATTYYELMHPSYEMFTPPFSCVAKNQIMTKPLILSDIHVLFFLALKPYIFNYIVASQYLTLH